MVGHIDLMCDWSQRALSICCGDVIETWHDLVTVVAMVFAIFIIDSSSPEQVDAPKNPLVWLFVITCDWKSSELSKCYEVMVETQ